MISHRCFILFTIVSAVFLLAGLSTPAIANEVSFGILGGFCGANQDWETPLGNRDREAIGGFNAGLFSDYKLSSVWSIRPSLTYVRKGSRSQEFMETTEAYPEGTGRMISFTDHYDYLSIAVPVKASLAAGGFVPYFLVGPRVDIKLSFDSPLYDMQVPGVPSGPEPYGGVKSVILGSEFGLGFSIDVNNGKAIMLELVVGIDYTDALSWGVNSVKNQAAILRLGLRL